MKTCQVLNKKHLARINYGARNQASIEREANKKPENRLRFRGVKSNQTRMSLSPSYIQTILSALELHQVMREALVGFTTDREFTCTACAVRRHPAPKVEYLVALIIPLTATLTQLCFYDAFHRADCDALGWIVMTFAFNAGGLVDHV